MQAGKFISMMVLISWSLGASSDPKGDWNSIPIFNQAPLEIKMGTYSDGPNSDLLAAVLWNDGINNRLNAIRIPPPYDGTGITNTVLENTATLFALGDICTDGTNVIVPYIKNFNLEVSRFNGVSWSQSTVPGTTTNNFDNADCGLTQDGIFLGTHDLTDGETEIFRSTNGGAGYTFYGRYTSSGPFDGAIREPLATSFSDRYLIGLNQQSNGQVRVTRTSTAGPSPSFTHATVENLSPPAGFTFVKEGAGAFNGAGITFTYNSEGTARAVEVPGTGPMTLTERDLGPISNNGSQFTFQGGHVSTYFNANNEPVLNKVTWGDYWYFGPYDDSTPTFSDTSYPLQGVGGPVSSCQVTLEGNYTHETHMFLGGPRVGSTGTDLHVRQVNVDAVFADGFESGDVTAWSASCP